MVVEAIAGYICDNVAPDMLGPKTGRFSGFIAFLFFGVPLSMNIAGIIPHQHAASSVVAVPMFFFAHHVRHSSSRAGVGSGRLYPSRLGCPFRMYPDHADEFPSPQPPCHADVATPVT